MADLKIECMVLGICQTNCYFVHRDDKKEGIVFDPADEGDTIYEALDGQGLQVTGILLTHGHFDHIWGSRRLKELTGAKIYAYEGEKALCGDVQANVSAQMGRPYTVEPDVFVRDGETLELAGMKCRLIATPGHTAGSCCYYFEEDEVLVSGDTLFSESVGRTDFPTGSMGALIRSIKEKLFMLPDEVKVYPGHGEMTKIGMEKKYNPFCQ